MGSSYKKIKYDTEGPYGSTEERWLYVEFNRSSDITTVYDDGGDIMFSFSETGFDMGMALNVILSNWYDERMIPISFDEVNEKLK